MGKLKSFLGNAVAVIYFVYVMLPFLLLLMLLPFMLISEINTIREVGSATSTIGTPLIGIFGIAFGISLLVPVLRKMYYKLPWMFPFVKILFLDVVILTVGVSILNFGYEVQSESRHTLFFILMLSQLILCRIAMCIYFSKKKVQYIGGDTNG